MRFLFKMDVTVLGSGSTVQFEGRGSASFLIETDGKKILLDAGFYLLDRMEKAGVKSDEIDAVYISHKHPDHFMGLIHLLFSLNHKSYDKKESITVFGFEGLKEWYQSFKDILGHWIEPGIKVIIREEPIGEFGNIEWEIFKTAHSPESTGIILRSENKKILYTGDTEYFDGLLELTENCDLVIAECGSGNEERSKGHMSTNDIEKIAKGSAIKKIVLTHIYPETDMTPDNWTESGTELTRSYDLYKISL